MAATRRTFLKAAAAAPILSFLPEGGVVRQSPNETIRAAVVGIRSRGAQLLNGLVALKGVQVVALCDVDQKFLDREAARFAQRGEDVSVERDLRKLLERKDIDAVFIASPNHWHALQGIWACQAGKDVYVEKPVSHNVWEGRQLVNAARKYGRIVQTGTQCRSSNGIHEAVDYVRSGILGRITLARGLCYKPRRSIGKIAEPTQPPASVDYDLWCGPAPKGPLRRKNLHYDWHWDRSTGNGDLGNQGIHQMDICRWALGDPGLPEAVTSIGGRLGYDDDGNTPNTQVVLFEYAEAPLLFEVRGLPKDRAQQAAQWQMDAYEGARIGVVIHCEKGRLVVPNYSSAVATHADGKEVRFQGAMNHLADFLAAVRSRKAHALSADIEKGHVSSALCHLGGISHACGRQAVRKEIEESVSPSPWLSEAFRRMAGHLESNGIDLGKPALTLGRRLKIDAAQESIADDAEAQARLTRNYRPGFVVPEIG